MTAPAAGRGGYCIGCGRKSPCKQKHTLVEQERLDAEAALEAERTARRRWEARS